ncbi:MAG: winged helix-turn-helix domain-containing protein [Acidobacteriota bacterium]|nr:winged helix-turn-helix domain-containing protein [Acidobacteriota bacterium]
MLNENLIATLEQSLRQTRNAQSRLTSRLHEIETEANSLKQEIEALENSAAQFGEAIYSLLASMGTGNKSWKVKKHAAQPYEDDDYNLEVELKRNSRMNPTVQNNQNHQNSQNQQSYQNHQNSQNNQNQPPNNNYRNNSVSYINHSRSVPQANQNFEPISNRFVDRTITQACTLLLREATSPLHVNELYNLLVAGGFEFKGNNPTISIAVSLNRNRRFRKVAPGTFELLMFNASQAAS